MTKTNYSTLDKFLVAFSLLLGIIGIIILVSFIVQLNSEYTILGENKLSLTETAQVGDFVGGMIGSLWTLSSIVLFYLAIRLQTKELSNSISELRIQTSTLKDQKEEFEISRLTNIIFHQINRIDRFVERFEMIYFSDVTADSRSYIGADALQSILENLTLENYDDSIQDKAALRRSVDLINRYYDKILSLADTYVSSSVAVERILTNSIIAPMKKGELQVLFNDNIGIAGNKILKRLKFAIDCANSHKVAFNLNEKELKYLSGILHTYSTLKI